MIDFGATFSSAQTMLQPPTEVEALINAWFDVQLGYNRQNARWYLLFPLTRMWLVNVGIKEAILAIVSPTTDILMKTPYPRLPVQS